MSSRFWCGGRGGAGKGTHGRVRGWRRGKGWECGRWAVAGRSAREASVDGSSLSVFLDQLLVRRVRNVLVLFSPSMADRTYRRALCELKVSRQASVPHSSFHIQVGGASALAGTIWTSSLSLSLSPLCNINQKPRSHSLPAPSSNTTSRHSPGFP